MMGEGDPQGSISTGVRSRPAYRQEDGQDRGRVLSQDDSHPKAEACVNAAGLGFSGHVSAWESDRTRRRPPELLATLALQGSIVTIDVMGTQPNIAQAIRDCGAD